MTRFSTSSGPLGCVVAHRCDSPSSKSTLVLPSFSSSATTPGPCFGCLTRVPTAGRSGVGRLLGACVPVETFPTIARFTPSLSRASRQLSAPLCAGCAGFRCGRCVQRPGRSLPAGKQCSGAGWIRLAAIRAAIRAQLKGISPYTTTSDQLRAQQTLLPMDPSSRAFSVSAIDLRRALRALAFAQVARSPVAPPG